MKSPIIGIDLGTTNSCGAVSDENGNVTLIPYRGGQFTVPSIFAIDDKGNDLVGYEAQRQWQLNPKNTVFGAKRLLGVNFESEIVREMIKRVGYEIKRGDADDITIVVGGKDLRLTDISSRILGKIREVASSYLGEDIKRAVVTVPAYYNDRQRQGVYEAGELVGLEIVRIINEPTAAALAYGARKNTNESVAVYDLGGGTFDLSVISIRDRVFEVRSTGGNIFLGGIDFDNALIQYILSDFNTQHGIDLATDPIAMQRIRDMAERVKVDLSARHEVPLSVPFITMAGGGKPLDLNMIVRRVDLEALTAHLVDKTFDTCARVIDEAGLKPSEIDQVLLVGGQTRMPLIQNRIADFFGKVPSKSVHPDEAVAIGAALYAWSLDDRSDLRFQLLDVLPMAISIEKADATLHRLFGRNCSVPNQCQVTFTTHRDNQKDLVMRIVQGDAATVHDNTLLGEFTFADLRPGGAGSVRVEVVFTVSAEGILSLTAKDLDTGTQMSHTVKIES
ncbi:MAG: 2-alkenal reductase [Deltaproteobacteria bacterium RIFOXYA12_FULL_58_15]|nr:MAG: 2-alkenal reductase [Deltaproteobacteria bacterium RIFOXYA12_FULL_58_15]OGR10199.1 MAG: 2-alkenal reductase [Deltaproteobacteria bacterium RIFOXYB12_FULL_58_9]